MFTLKTPRLILRDFQQNDFDAFYATTNDPEYQKFYAEHETTHSFWQEIFARIMAGAAEAARIKYQLAICLPTGELIGTCGIRIEDQANQQASFGCAIARNFWGKGYAYEASYAIINYGFSSLSIHRIYAETISENKKSRALAERLGMRLEGEFKHHRFFRDRWWNTAVYAMLKDEWHDS